MFCRYCGKEIPEDSRFCQHCGKPQEPCGSPGADGPGQNNGCAGTSGPYGQGGNSYGPNGGVYGQYCTRIYGSYLFHSVYYYRTVKNQMSTAEYNKLGSQASAGCIRLAVTDAKWIYDHCSIGTRVVIGESRTLKKPTRSKLKVSTARRTGWDPTDPDPANPYYPKIRLKKSASKKMPYGRKMNKKKLRKLIKVTSPTTSTSTLLKNVTVKGKVKSSKPGKYNITYTVTDPRTLLTKSLKVTFTVKKPKKTAVPAAPATPPVSAPQTPAV